MQLGPAAIRSVGLPSAFAFDGGGKPYRKFTNKIRNPRGEGGTIGVIGAGGSSPTNWGYNTGGVGLSIELIGNGVRYGLPYTRVRFSGTAVGSGQIRFYFETGSNIAVTAGQAWGQDLWVERISGALEMIPQIIVRANTNLDIGLRIVDGTRQTGNSFQRISATAVIADPTATNVAGSVRIAAAGGGNIISGQSYDTTFDIFAPKSVQLSVIEGPELVVNGSFDNGLANWHNFPQGTGSTSVVNGAANMLETNSANRGRIGSLALMTVVANSTYKTSFKHTGPQVQLFSSSGLDGAGTLYSSPSSPLTGTEVVRTGFFVPTATTAAIFFQPTGATAGTVIVDDVSVKGQTPGYLPAYPIIPPVGTPGDSSSFAAAA